jgi:3-phosphoshikimate 1-carboxyvinyltransferase
MGVDVECPTGCPPVRVHGRGGLTAARVEIDGRLSSQFVSALLMIAPFGDDAIEVALTGEEIGARGYVDLTVAVMRQFGASVDEQGDRTWRVRPIRYRSADLDVEPDASAATYLWAAEVLTGGRIDIGGSLVRSAQPDARAAALIARFPNLPSVIEGSQMQDAVPTLAVLAAFNRTPVRFTGIRNLRVKECDRVNALATELSRIRPGLGVEEGDDLLIASDPGLAGQRLPADIQTYSDHRIAMSMALAGLKIEGITILDPASVDKTYPAFWDDLTSLGVELRPGASS